MIFQDLYRKVFRRPAIIDKTGSTIKTIVPYRIRGTGWFFDDFDLNVVEEAFVGGMPEIIDTLLKEQGIDPDSVSEGFLATFSAGSFPEHQAVLYWKGGSKAGNYYIYTNKEGEVMEGWLCPCLFKYFAKAPMRIYVAVKEFNTW